MGSEEEKPSLEAPSLGFRRRRKARPEPSGEQETDADRPTVEDPPTVDDAPPVGAVDEPSSEPGGRDLSQTQVLVGVRPPADRARRPRRPLNGHVAASVAGLVVAAFLVLATLGGLRSCESIRGTTSCGGGPGFVMLVLILVLAVALGAAVLRWAGVASAGSISVLAVALVAVVSGLFLGDVLDQLSGAIAAAALTVASYLLAHSVTSRWIDTAT